MQDPGRVQIASLKLHKIKVHNHYEWVSRTRAESVDWCAHMGGPHCQVWDSVFAVLAVGTPYCQHSRLSHSFTLD